MSHVPLQYFRELESRYLRTRGRRDQRMRLYRPSIFSVCGRRRDVVLLVTSSAMTAEQLTLLPSKNLRHLIPTGPWIDYGVCRSPDFRNHPPQLWWVGTTSSVLSLAFWLLPTVASCLGHLSCSKILVRMPRRTTTF